MSTGLLSLTRQLAKEWAQRLWLTRGWCTTMVVGLALLLLGGIGWTRIAEKHWWQVVLTLLIPVLLLAALLLLQAGMVRALVRPIDTTDSVAGKTVSIAWGAATLLLCMLIVWAAWSLLNRFDDQIQLWAGYLNSRFGAGARAKVATEEHIGLYLSHIESVLRWVILPGLLMPLSSSAAWGLRRLPWRRVVPVWLSWRWWPGVLCAALLGIAWPESFFAALPHGTVSAQVWRVVLKLLAGYFLVVGSWIALTAWSMTLLCSGGAKAKRSEDDSDDLLGVGVRVNRPDGGKSGSVSLPLPESGDDA